MKERPSCSDNEKRQEQHQTPILSTALNKVRAQDLLAASKKKECSDLAPWIQSVVNHLWWCAATSNGDQLLCQEKWKSIVYHVADRHEWPDFQLFSECKQEELTNEQRRNKVWLPIGSPAHNALKEMVWTPNLLKDVCLLADFIQTGCLGVFHGRWLRSTPLSLNTIHTMA